MKNGQPLDDGSSRSRPVGRILLLILSVSLFSAGCVALFLGLNQQFLPHDERFLGMTAGQLCTWDGCRVVHFMIHDRVSFGGALVAIGALYFWLVEVPLRGGAAWAWWTLGLSGAVGFASFLSYLGYGYLDVWHLVATLGILPCYVLGMLWYRPSSWSLRSIRSLLQPSLPLAWNPARGLGRNCLLATAAGLVGAGMTILIVGMTCVFVPQDLVYLGVGPEELRALNPRLLPLIAHDRAGFGGAVCSGGIALFFCVWRGQPSSSLWWTLLVAGAVAFGAAIGIHPLIGYTDPVHLAPAVLGAILYALGLALTFPWRALPTSASIDLGGKNQANRHD